MHLWLPGPAWLKLSDGLSLFSQMLVAGRQSFASLLRCWPKQLSLVGMVWQPTSCAALSLIP